MKQFISELINALDYRNEFSTKEFILYSIISITCLALATCGESIILSLF